MDDQRIELRIVACKRKHDAAAMRSVRSDVFARGIGDDLFPRQRTVRREHHQRNLSAEDEGQAVVFMKWNVLQRRCPDRVIATVALPHNVDASPE